MLISEATRAALLAKGWRLETSSYFSTNEMQEVWRCKAALMIIDANGVPRFIPAYDLGFPVSTILEALSCGIKVPGYVVTRADPGGIVQDVADLLASYDADKVKVTAKLEEFFAEEVPKDDD